MCFDALLMVGAMLAMNVWHPYAVVSGRVGRDGMEDGMGNGNAQLQQIDSV